MFSKLDLKKYLMGTLLSTALLTMGSYTAYAGEQTQDSLETDVVHVTVNTQDNSFFRISMEAPTSEGNSETGVRQGNLHFENVNLFTRHGQRLDPGDDDSKRVSVIIDSHENFSIAVEADGDFIDHETGKYLPLSHFRSRVDSRTFDGTTIAHNNMAAGTNAGNHRSTVGIINNSHNMTSLTTTPREIIRSTTARGENIEFRMRYDFLADRFLPIGDFETTIRYTAWQN